MYQNMKIDETPKCIQNKKKKKKTEKMFEESRNITRKNQNSWI